MNAHKKVSRFVLNTLKWLLKLDRWILLHKANTPNRDAKRHVTSPTDDVTRLTDVTAAIFGSRVVTWRHITIYMSNTA